MLGHGLEAGAERGVQPVPPRRAAHAQQRLGEVRGDRVLCHVLYVQHRVVSGRLGGGAVGGQRAARPAQRGERELVEG